MTPNFGTSMGDFLAYESEPPMTHAALLARGIVRWLFIATVAWLGWSVLGFGSALGLAEPGWPEILGGVLVVGFSTALLGRAWETGRLGARQTFADTVRADSEKAAAERSRANAEEVPPRRSVM